MKFILLNSVFEPNQKCSCQKIRTYLRPISGNEYRHPLESHFFDFVNDLQN